MKYALLCMLFIDTISHVEFVGFFFFIFVFKKIVELRIFFNSMFKLNDTSIWHRQRKHKIKDNCKIIETISMHVVIYKIIKKSKFSCIQNLATTLYSKRCEPVLFFSPASLWFTMDSHTVVYFSDSIFVPIIMIESDFYDRNEFHPLALTRVLDRATAT